MEDRVRLEMERENIPEDEARHILEKDDYERRKWALALYGIDTAEACLYDLVIHIRNVTVWDAVDMICKTAGLPQFRTTKAMDNLVLAAQVKSTIIKEWPQAAVSADDGYVVVHVEAPLIQESTICEELLPIIRTIQGVRNAKVHLLPSTFFGNN